MVPYSECGTGITPQRYSEIAAGEIQNWICKQLYFITKK